MSVRTIRLGGVLLLAALLSACSTSRGPDRGNDCSASRNSCMYEGSYEPGEREYAEREASRLNKAAARRLRRS
ncbi:hypothetical protein FOZ76_08825 [Verticiella sediminum]|uniref:Lipoprotein n=1 Tax=Verticiella sediminum TaxID=1247510 RepID=A0A556AUP3_9BURK|nr:hypothetical protein [Verticiella sediminum]TSH96668.1 hypothetical protein FOZ76_08825 [Verticiella sediminum]